MSDNERVVSKPRLFERRLQHSTSCLLRLKTLFTCFKLCTGPVAITPLPNQLVSNPTLIEVATTRLVGGPAKGAIYRLCVNQTFCTSTVPFQLIQQVLEAS